jgi:hypothetical protein
MTPSTPTRRTRRRSDVWQTAALVLSVIATLLLLVLPLYSSSTRSSDSPDAVVTTSTLLEEEGSGVLGILAVPVVLMLVPLYFRGGARRWVSLVCTVLLFVGALLGLASIGAFYLPALVCSIAAATSAMTEARAR